MITIKEIMDVYMDEGYSINRVFRDSKFHSDDIHTPFKYKGKYEYIGYADIWNEVGCIEYNFKMYRPIGSGTIIYI